MNQKSELAVFTIGYSTRSLEEFTELLQIYGITLLADIRAVPQSRYNPQFNKEALPDSLKRSGIKYLHIPELGGLRHPKPNSSNLALEGQLRGYADYMQTKEFTDQLLKILALARENRLSLMCTEALPYNCHRILVSDVLTARHVQVLHIISKENTVTHKINELAQVEGIRVTYMLYTKESPQRTLSDFGTT
ncbi:DUF488 domain-containing protein [Candidatus Bathycorpusculum sp.]|uniref:DUF488 domain-containing protein n=1 Tax=Candidatus Bathycorpusculum sp. TaxID=2994959 RepID=UPI00281813E2|nr:DUF488 domain-containing protein [Candidatus Termitimicrobium sp.]MCL2685367.1 DUF488 domain-containing protein [Candidatus Termitimicrobium sp.]